VFPGRFQRKTGEESIRISRTYQGGRKPRVFVEMRRNGRRSHQTVHDDSRMAADIIETNSRITLSEREKKVREKGAQKGEVGSRSAKKREAVEKKTQGCCGRQRSPSVQLSRSLYNVADG
jgi:hypothetical protein